jgi:hypothetical protein
MRICSRLARFLGDETGFLFSHVHHFLLVGLFLAGVCRAEIPQTPVMPVAVGSDSSIAAVHDSAKATNDSGSGPTDSTKTKAAKEMEQIVVTGHYQNKVGTTDNAASSGTYTSQLLEDRPILRPGEVEEVVPGLIVTQHSGAGKANQFLLRGFNLDHGTDFATSIDGVPVNLPTQAHGQGYDDLNFFIPELIDHANYFKGPYYASNGDFSSAGAINLFYDNQLAHPFVTATVGSFNYYRGLAASSTDLAGGKLLLGFEAMHQDGPFDVPEDYNKYNGLLRWSHQLGEGMFNIEAMAYSGEWNATNHIPQRAVTEGLIDRWGTEDSSDGGNSHRYSLSSSWKGELGGGVLKATAYAVKYDMDLFSNFTYYLVDTVNGDQMNQVDKRWFYGTSDVWQREDTVLGIQEKYRGGLDARCDLISPVALYHTVDRRRLESWGVDTVTEPKIEPWVDEESQLTPWMRVMLGLRYVYLYANVHCDDTVNSASSSGEILLPKASVVLGPWDKNEFYLNYGDGYHSNDARGTTAIIQQSTGDSVPKVTLLVRSRGFEVGARNDAIPGLQSTIALWLLDLNSELVWDADVGTTDPAGPTRRMGVEWTENWQPIRWLLFDFDMALSRARFTDNEGTNGQYVPEAINSMAAAGATIHQLGPWSASLFMRYLGPRALTQNDSIQSASSTLFNSQIAYDLNSKVRLTLDILNIFNAQINDMEYYYTTRLKGEPAAGIADYEIHPAEPLQFRLSLTTKF